MRVSAIVPAAGQGKRMGGSQNKVYLSLGNKTILESTIAVLSEVQEIVEVIVVVRAEEVETCQDLMAGGTQKKPYKVIAGGTERQDSVEAGLAVLCEDVEYVMIHDGARPLITLDQIREAFRAVKKHGTAVLAVPMKDTVKVVREDGFVEQTLVRSSLRAVQTPQIFPRKMIVEAYKNARKSGIVATDDASLVEAMGESVYLVPGSYENIKITTPEDMLLAEEILRRRLL